jgi:hypothetical protein
LKLNHQPGFDGDSSGFDAVKSGARYLLPSGKHTKNYGKSQFLMGKLTISVAIFNSYVSLPEGTSSYKLQGIMSSQYLIIMADVDSLTFSFFCFHISFFKERNRYRMIE